MIWNVRHPQQKERRMAVNRYCYYGQIFVLNKVGLPAHITHSKKGVDQGCIMSMNLYGTVLLSPAQQLNLIVPDAVKPFYADDASLVGPVHRTTECLEFLKVWWAQGMGTSARG
jgi:hypothetical protein